MSKDFGENTPTVELADGTRIPQIGFGTFRIQPEDTQRAVELALACGYRHVDTAAAYRNEAGVGAALAATGMAGRVFVTTKLRNCDQGFDETLRACEASRAALGVDAIDLYLIHWPVPMWDRYVDTWRALIRLQQEGAVRAIGVSNFMGDHIERLCTETGVAPAIDQIEAHPSFWQPGLTESLRGRGIAVEAFAPLGSGKDISAEPVIAAAGAHGVTPAQVVLRWHLQSGRVFIPKSSHPERMRENLDLVGFELTDEEMASIDALDAPEHRLFGDPYTYDRPQTLEDMIARGNIAPTVR